ncbi:MAG: hypothetical protein H7A43_06980 [Verrucomicrobia bacterium]|nr:hypothetical protein [Verrucomicrobiota bacterium]
MKLILDTSILIVTVMMMLAIGMQLAREPNLTRAPRLGSLALILILHMCLLPVIAWLTCRWLEIRPALAIGLMVVAACPVGDISNFYVWLVRGNVWVSLWLNVVSCLFAVASMAGIYHLYSWLSGSPFLMALPTLGMVVRLLALIVLPLSAGILAGWRFPCAADALTPWLRRATGAGILWVVCLIVVMRWGQLREEAAEAALASLVFLSLATMTGVGAALLVTRSRRERIAIAFSFPVRNVGLATALVVILMNQVGYAAFAVVYFVVEVFFMLAVAGITARICPAGREETTRLGAS